jgi:hypothetical protein
MPCRDGGPSPAQIENDDLRKEVKRLERLEPLLCSACKSLENLGFDFGINPELDEWHHKHKEEDRKREEIQARVDFRRRLALEASKKPVNELSVDERRALKSEGYL